jgi:hypothetical protein
MSPRPLDWQPPKQSMIARNGPGQTAGAKCRSLLFPLQGALLFAFDLLKITILLHHNLIRRASSRIIGH